MTLVTLENNRPLGNGRDGPHIPEQRRVGLGNTNPVATLGTLGPGAPFIPGSAMKGIFRLHNTPGPVFVVQAEEGTDVYLRSVEGQLIVETMRPPTVKVLKPVGQIVLFKNVMDDWGFNDQEAAALLGFETASDIDEIYLGMKPVRQRDANDRLRAILRIATDLDALFGEVAAIRDWLSEPQRDLDGATPRALLIEYYVAYLSGR